MLSMVEITPKGKYFIAAAILGLISYVLPWITFTLSNGVASAISGESPATLLSDLVTAPRVTPTTDAAIIAWQQATQAEFGTWIAGAVIFLVACFVTLFQAFESGRWGGFWMLLGTLVSTAGILGMSAQFTTDAGYTATVGPSLGIGLAVIACLVALVPAFKVEVEDRWVRDAVGHGWVRTTELPPLSHPAQSSMAMPLHSPSTQAATPSAPERRFCPECGAWYLSGEVVCPRDGTTLKPVRGAAFTLGTGEVGSR